MDNPAYKMDISTPPAFDRRPLRSDIRTIQLPTHPLCPWMRLAGSFATTEERAVDYARLRTISDYEIILQVHGTTWLWFEEAGSIDIGPGDVLFIPPGFVHGQAYTAGMHCAVHFDLHARLSLAPYDNLHPTNRVVNRKPSHSLPIFALKHAQSRPELALPLVTATRNPRVWSGYLARLAVIHSSERPLSTPDQFFVCEALGWMLRTLSADAAYMDISSPPTREASVEALIGEMDRRPDISPSSGISVIEMARLAGMGETAFRQCFLRLTGRSPHAYLEERRIARAKHLLIATDLPVKEVAKASGYDDPYHFSRVYRRVAGMSPREFRRRLQSRAVPDLDDSSAPSAPPPILPQR